MKHFQCILLTMVFVLTFSTTALGGQAKASDDPSSVYTVQVASFKELWRARNMAAYLDINGFKSSIMLMKGRGGVDWYVVRSGEYDGFRTAKKKAWAIEDFMREGTLVRKATRAFLAERNVPSGIQLASTWEIKKTSTTAKGRTSVKTVARAVPEPVVLPAGTPVAAKAPAAAPKKSYALAKKPYPDAPTAVTFIDHKTHEKLAAKGLSVSLRATDAGKAVQDPAQTERAYPQKDVQAAKVAETTRIYTVQVASFNRPDRARKMVGILSNNGFDAYAISMFGWHVVHSGEFTSYADAKARQTKLEEAVGEATIIRDLSPAFVTRHKERFTLASAPAQAPAQAPAKKALKRAEPKNKPAPEARATDAKDGTMVTVVKYKDARQAGNSVRSLREGGVSATVVYMGGETPWYVVRTEGSHLSRAQAVAAIQAAQ